MNENNLSVYDYNRVDPSLDTEPRELSPSIYGDWHKIWTYWKSKLVSAARKLKIKENLSTWQENYKRLHGKCFVEIGDRVYPSLNESGQATEELLALCFPTTPLPQFGADRPRDEEQLENYEWLCHNTIRQGRNKQALRDAVTDAVCCRRGILKAAIEYEAEEDEEGNFPPGPEPEELPEEIVAQQMLQIGNEHRAVMSGQPVGRTESDVDWLHIDRHAQQLTQLDILSDGYWNLAMHLQEHYAFYTPARGGRVIYTRVSSEDFLYDPDARYPHEWTWTAEAVYEHIDDVANDPMMFYTDGLVPNDRRRSDMMRDDGDLEADADPADPEGDADEDKPSYVRLWRIHDRRNGRLIIMSLDHKDELPNLVDRWPFKPNIYLPLDLNPSAEPTDVPTIMEKVWPIQQELDEIEAKISLLIRQYMPKIAIEDGAFEPGDREQLEDPNSPYIHMLPGMADKLKTLNLIPELGPLYARKEQLIQSIRKTIGVWEISYGLEKSNTATKTNAMMSREQMKTQPKRDLVNAWLSEVCETTVQLYREYNSTEIMVECRGGAEGLRWRTIRPEEIGRDLHATIEDFSWGSPNSDFERNQWIQLLPIIAGNPRTNQERLLTETYRRFGIRNPDKFITPLPPMPPMIQGPPNGTQPISGVPNLPGPEPVGQMVGNAVGAQIRPGTPAPPTAGVTPAG